MPKINKKHHQIILISLFLVALILTIIYLKNSKQKEPRLSEEESISALLPEGVFLRDYQRVPNVGHELMLVLYIEKDYQFSPWSFESCPGAILGKAIRGQYHLALVNSQQLIDDIAVPAAYVESQPSGLELAYENTKENLYPVGQYDNKDKDQLETVKLLKLQDYTGDNQEYEFLLTTTAGGCGFWDGLVAGYDPVDKKLVLYSGWLPRLKPNQKGEFDYLFDCGDHGNQTRVESRYQFNPQTKEFEKVWEKETDCITSDNSS
ncbi:MAG TPA: hypothetical protein VMW41_02920 [Candidatus Bathyarchaeia archaeon]|nr:hypothetical protein [Candidatus Bathyarchaeia archaeon]